MALYASHIDTEERLLYPAAAGLIAPEALQRMSDDMRRRRAASVPQRRLRFEREALAVRRRAIDGKDAPSSAITAFCWNPQRHWARRLILAKVDQRWTF